MLFFKLFANCVPIDGFAINAIYDLQNNYLLYIDKIIYDILLDSANLSICEIKEKYNHEYDEGIKLYFEEFVGSGIAHYTTKPEFFPILDTTWEYPGIIRNATLEFTSESDYELVQVIEELESLGCEDIQIRFFDVNFLEIKKILSCFNHSRVRSFELFLENCKLIDYDLIDMVDNIKRISHVFVSSSCDIDNIQHKRMSVFKKKLVKGMIAPHSKSSLYPTLDVFCESHHFDCGSNAKIAVNCNGDILNFIGHPETFGNVITDSLESVAISDEFQASWTIKKSMIKKCSGCHFRFCCLHESPITINNGVFEYTHECSFNPITNEWKS